MFYVGVIRYFATGEGVTLYVVSGCEESIREVIPESFWPGLMLLTPTDWLKAAEGDGIDEYTQSDAQAVKTNLPLLCKQIEELATGRGVNLEFFMMHHFNYA